MLDKTIKPSTIVKNLDQYVIGQDEAKKVLAVAVYSHYRKIEKARKDALELIKSNVLLIGPSGTGKTLLCETLSRVLGVPFVTADAMSLAQTRYVNEEIEAILQRLIDKAEGKLDRAELGIVFIDEIDKLKTKSGAVGGVSGESVQHALLKIMEGSQVKLSGGQYIDTTRLLFICGGAFVGLDEIMAGAHTYGFISTSLSDDKTILDRLNQRVKPTDLFQFGLIPEFTGRLPIIARFHDLTKDMLVRIMVEPKNSIHNQYLEIFRNEGVELAVARKVFEQIANLAIEYKAGARSLRGIFEELITPILYTVPDDPTIRSVEIESLFTEPRYVRQT
ncbi:MAG TPA: ATP-dependent Clp protease ATP-binding subunit ClpX [Burkholderiales bacterium]|nr:ATP-dependent Clp protease ATP-binding subunit ClpX [Burkholderiales bacterium]